MPYQREAIVRLRRGSHWQIKPEAEALDGRKVRVFHPIENERKGSVYFGENEWHIHQDDIMPHEPSWLAEGDLEFIG